MTETIFKSSAGAKESPVGEVRERQPRRSHYDPDRGARIAPIGDTLDIYGREGRGLRHRLRIYGGRAKVGNRL